MELEQLKQFQKVAEHENISRAAEELFISQPTLTRSMYNLEADLGVKLFDRKKNRIKLNDCGRKILQHVNQILDEVEKMKIEAKNYEPEQYILNIYSSMPSSLRYFVRKYSEENVDANITVTTRTIDDSMAEKSLLNKSADIVVCGSECSSDEIEQILYYTFDMKLTVPKTYPFARKDTVSWEELYGMNFLLPGKPDSLAKRRILNELHGRFKHPSIIVEEDFVLFTEMLKKSNCLAFTSPFSINYHENHRVLVPITDGAVKISLYISYLKDNAEKVEPFVKWMVDNYNKITEALG